MTESEFKQSWAEIEAKAKEAKKRLSIAYCKSNARFVVGDFITNGVVTIKVEGMTTVWSSSGMHLPFCQYYGPSLTKKLERRKDGSMRRITDNGETTVIKLVPWR